MKKLVMILTVFSFLCFVISCQNQEATAELAQLHAQADIETQNVELIKHYMEELDTGGAEILNKYYAPDAAYYFPSGSAEPMTLDQEIEQTKMFMSGIPDLTHDIEEIMAVGDKVIVRFVGRGTHTGDLGMGIPPTGNKIEVSSIVIFRLANGKVVEERQDADMLGLMQQFGMELRLKEKE